MVLKQCEQIWHLLIYLFLATKIGKLYGQLRIFGINIKIDFDWVTFELSYWQGRLKNKENTISLFLQLNQDQILGVFNEFCMSHLGFSGNVGYFLVTDKGDRWRWELL